MNAKTIAKLLTIALIGLIIFGLVASARAYVVNENPDKDTTWVDPSYASYLSARNSAYQRAREKYGDPMNPAYEWAQYLGNDPGRTGFNPGPAPDRPDVLWTTYEWSGATGTKLGTASPGMVAFAGKVFVASTKLLPNGTSRAHLNALDAATGELKWQTPLFAGWSFTSAFGATVLFKVTDEYVGARVGGQGFAVWRASDGQFVWNDPTITPGAVYHPALLSYDKLRIYGPRSITGRYVPLLGGWDLSDPGVAKDPGKRSLWNYTMDEPGNPMLAYGQGLVFMGSYSSYAVYAINATTGEKVWETLLTGASGYAGCYADGKLFVGCQHMVITCLNATTGEIIWQNKEGLKNRAFNVWNIMYAYGRVYLHDLGAGTTGATKCLDANTGETLWASQTLFYIGYYQTAIADGKVYGYQSDFSVTTGREPAPLRFYCWDAFTGEKIWDLPHAIAWPMIAYGCLYFVEGGAVYALSTAYPPDDWTMWRGNVENPGFTWDRGPLNLNVGPKWSFQTGGGIISSPAVANGKVYIGSNDKHVYCIDAYNGSLIWKFKLENHEAMTVYGSSPAVVGNKVITGPDDGYIYCLDANTGEKLWKLDVGPYRPIQVSLGQFNLKPSPIIYNNRIYIGSPYNNKTYCIDLSGRVVWSNTTTGPILSSAAIEGGIAYFISWGRGTTADRDWVYMYNADTGAFIRRFQVARSFPRVTGGAFATAFATYPSYTPVVVKDRLYIGTQTATMACYNTTTGTLIWQAEMPYVLGENSMGSPVYVNVTRGTIGTKIYFPTGPKVFCQAGPTIACVNATWRSGISVIPYNTTGPTGKYGTALWSAWTGWESWSSAVFSGMSFVDGRVYIGSESYSVTCYNATNGYPLSWYTAGGNIPGSPAIYDGKLYIGSADGKIYCFEDHPIFPMEITMSIDKIQLQKGETLTATVKLTGTNTLNPRDWTQYRPPLPNATVLLTLTDPDGTEHNVTATTDLYGKAVLSFTPTKGGTWKVIAWYCGEDKPTYSYGYAFSDEVTVEVSEPTTPPPPPPPPPAQEQPWISTEALIAIAAIIIIIIIAAALYIFKRKK